MDILILNWKDIKNPDVGGAEIILYELAKRFVRDGHRVTWFCREYAGGKAVDLYDGIHVLRKGNRLSVYWEAYKYYRSLSVKPDKVLDCVNTMCWQTPLYVPKNNRVAYVNQLAKEVLYYELPPILSHILYLLEPLEYLTYKNTRFICYSDSVKKDITSFNISEKNIHTFPIGLDHNRYIPGNKSNDPLFLFVARLARMKRPELCVSAMKIVISTYPNATLAIVGYGPLERQLERIIIANDLAKNVFLVNKDALFFHKSVKDKKVKLMQQAWALLLPSVKEGWGMVVTEAGACGTASIVSGVTGLVDSVSHKKTGIVLSANPTKDELANSMMRIIEDKAFRIKLEKGAIQKAGAYTWENAYQAVSTSINAV